METSTTHLMYSHASTIKHTSADTERGSMMLKRM